VKKLLIANRGEIAVRIARTAREMGLRTVAVASEVDARALHVRTCDEHVVLGPAEPARSYLDVAAVLAAARSTGADAVHPGYGFLSENADFARAVIDAGLTWVGPTPDSMDRMGDKIAARQAARAAGLPVIEGVESDDTAAVAAIGFPLLVKAAAGGGGKGMRVVASAQDLPHALAEARSEATAAFGDGTVYAERYLVRPRHVEVQVLGDGRGAVWALGERECSVQRRHQKLVEESACVALDPATRTRLLDGACALARSVGYVGAGTLEFLLDAEGRFWFLEMNTRLQVEHPVTELRYGRDLVRDQLLVAAGEPVEPPGEPLGHAIECRLVAEDPAAGFVPGPGQIRALRWPEGPGIRVDAGVAAGDEVPVHYDPLLAKLVVHAPDREAARRRMVRALTELVLVGVPHTGELLREVLEHPAFAAGELATDFLPRHFEGWQPPAVDLPLYVAAARALSGGARPTGAVAARLPGPWETVGRWS